MWWFRDVPPDQMANIVQALWPIFVALFVALVWFVRLEAEVRFLRKEYEEHKAQQLQHDKTMESKIDTMQHAMNSLLQAIGRMEGRMEGKREIERGHG